jgi:hypothetical protein
LRTGAHFGRNRPKAPLNEKFNAPIGDQYTAWLGGDYVGYTSYRPLYDRYVEAVEHQADRPSFEEDSFRLRSDPEWTHKDYSADLTRKGLWHSTMAGGVANIWGNLLPRADQGGSQSYDHGDVRIKHQIKTYATFFRDKRRFRKEFIRDNHLADPRAGTTETTCALCCSIFAPGFPGSTSSSPSIIPADARIRNSPSPDSVCHHRLPVSATRTAGWISSSSAQRGRSSTSGKRPRWAGPAGERQAAQ